MTDYARVARYELPGKRWFFASCQACAWAGLDWKHKSEAIRDRDHHNERHDELDNSRSTFKSKHP